MADVWAAEVTVSSSSYSGPTAGLTGFLGDVLIAKYVFYGIDPDGRFPAIEIAILSTSGTGAIKCRERHGFASLASSPIVVGADSAEYTSAGSTSLFTGGGTLTITKDDTTDTYTWSGPSGSDSLGYGSIPGIVTDGELAPDTLYVYATVAFTGGGITANQVIVNVPWHDFWGSKNASHIKGADLGSTDRGSWIPSGGPLTPWFVGISGNATVTSPDTGTEIVAHIQADPAAGPLGNGSATQQRHWDQSVYLTTGSTGRAVDMTHSPQHGSLYADLVYGASPDTLKWRRSFDKGSTWEEGTIYTAGGTTNNSPSIGWLEGNLWAVWYNGTDILQSFSRDDGTTWSSPVALSITGTNPSLLIDPKHGVAFYFYIDGSDLKLVRSGNFGTDMIDATPIGVATGIGTQTVAAELAPGGVIVVGYVISGAWTQKRSRDYGLTWS